MNRALALDWPQDIFDLFKQFEITLVSYVPDAGHMRLLTLCESEPSMKTIVLTTEEEGVALAAGAHLGGARSVLLMQSSGAGNCINMLSLVRTCGFPLLTLVTMRGEWGEFNPWQTPMGQATQSVLEAMGLVVYRVSAPDEVRETVEAAIRFAFDSQMGVAVLLSQRLIGAKSFGRK
jgi:sulfopyruvate decarboxylase alpha subunit